MEQVDVIVIGAGPAGYPAALRAAQRGLSVLCVDDWKNRDGKESLGGTCLNAGCIPSKALLESSEWWHKVNHQSAVHGIEVGKTAFDLSAMQKRKAKIVSASTQGIQGLLKAAKVQTIHGRGRLLKDRVVEITTASNEIKTVQAHKAVVLAVGSTPVELPHIPFDHHTILDSWDALDLTAVPERLAVIGAGVIGLELGSVWSRLGAKVTLVEAMENFLPAADRQVATEALKQFKKQGLDIRLGAKVQAVTKSAAGLDVAYTSVDGKTESLQVDRVIVAVGRKPQTQGVLSADSGVTVNARGFIEVNDHCETSVPGVYAVGDCVRGAMLAHKGKEEGVMVADRIAGLYGHVNYQAIPSVIYTHPEIAWVGLSEADAAAQGRAVKLGVFPFMASGRARAMESADGFVKVIAAKDNDELLGVHIIGPMAGELIAEAVLAMEYSASAEDLQRTMHAHPTLSEALHEAALLVDGLAIDFPNKAR